MLLARHPLFCSTRTPIFGVGISIGQDGARVEIIDSFHKGKNLGLVSINKLKQLRKFIFDK